MAAATEIVFIKVRDGIDLNDASSAGAQTFAKATTTLSEQKGFKRCYWGMRVEEPTTFTWTIDWDDITSHQAFVNSETYLPFTTQLSEVFDFAASPPFIYHVNFTSQPSLAAARDAPVTEFATFNIPVSASSEEKSGLEDAILGVAKFCDENGSTGVAVGWAIEEVEASEGKVSVLQAIIGWENVDAHMKARALEQFKDVVAPVRKVCVAPREGMAMFHAGLKKQVEVEKIN